MTTTPGQYDITIYQGTTFSQVFTWKDSNAVPVNLTGYTARMMARSARTTVSPFLTLTTENGGIALGGSAGTITLSQTAAQTAAITDTNGVYDLELVASDTTVTRLLMGTLIIDKEVTR